MLLASVVSATGCINTGSLQAPTGLGGAAGTATMSEAAGAPEVGSGAAGKAEVGGAGGPAGHGGVAGAPGPLGCAMNGLIAHYTFDTDTTDSSGNGHDIVATAVTPTTGILGGAYLLDGFSSLMQVTGGTDSLDGDRTLCAWVHPQSVTGFAQPVFVGGEVGNGDFFSLTSSTPSAANTSCMGSTEGEPFLDHGGGCVYYGLYGPTTRIAANGVWSLVCYVFQLGDGYYSGDVEDFFVNGTSEGISGENYSYPVSTLTIGSSTLGGTSTRSAFRGAIDDVTIWGRALSSDELGSLWNGGLGCSPPKASTGIALVTGADGQLEANAAGAMGKWYSAGDAYAADGTPGAGNCETAGLPMTACSSITTPIPGTTFGPDPNGRMCAAGTAAQVVTGPDGQLAWSSLWGNMVGLGFANSDSADASTSGTFDAPAHGITGIGFDIAGIIPQGRVRVLVGTAENDTNSAYWDGATMNVSPFDGPGHYEFRWPEVGGPMYLGAAAPPFDPTQIENIAFHIVGDTPGPAPYSFCISNLLLLTN
jgi:hypothetical protein